MPSPVPHIPWDIPGTIPAAGEPGAQAGIGDGAGPVPPLPWAAPGGAWGHLLSRATLSPHTPWHGHRQQLGASTANLPALLGARAGERLSTVTLVFSQILLHDAADIVFLPFCLRPAARPAALGAGFATAALPVPPLGLRPALDAVGTPGGEEGARG